MRSALTLLAVLATTAACVQVLGYDDYRERPASGAADSAVTDVAPGEVGDAGETRARVPARPPGEAKPSGKGRTLWLGAKHMYVGSQTSLGVKSTSAWKEWGFDLDSVCTSADDSVKNVGTCRRHPEAGQQILTDGDLCRDNNFGQHVIALLSVSSDGFETRINDGLLKGNNTWIIRIDDLDDGADDAYAPARFYRGGDAKSGSVLWDGSDVRQVLSDSILDRDLNRSKVTFLNGYVRGNVWVSGEPTAEQIDLPISADINLRMIAAQVTIALDMDHRSGKRGMLGGAMPISQLESLLRPLALSSGFCPGTPLYESLFTTISRYPDVVIGAPGLQDPAVQCDGLSIGLGFDVQSVQPVTEVVDPPPPDPSKCDDAGVGGG